MTYPHCQCATRAIFSSLKILKLAPTGRYSVPIVTLTLLEFSLSPLIHSDGNFWQLLVTNGYIWRLMVTFGN